MKKYHGISSLKFEDCFLVITIDGEPKKMAEDLNTDII
jgi:hypothetical protein